MIEAPLLKRAHRRTSKGGRTAAIDRRAYRRDARSPGLSGVLARHQEPRRLEVILVISIKKRIDLADGKVDCCERVAAREDIDLAHATLKRLPKRVADADGPEPEDRMGAALRGRRGELETPV